MYSRRGAAQYRAVRSHGLVADASPVRLVQIMFEQILAQLTTAQGCMHRINGNLPLSEVKTKCTALNKAVRLIIQLSESLDMERGREIAQNLRSLYDYMLTRLTVANASNDPRIVGEIINLVQTIKTGWDKIVEDQK
jgi:flagellar protein FliS